MPSLFSHPSSSVLLLSVLLLHGLDFDKERLCLEGGKIPLQSSSHSFAAIAQEWFPSKMSGEVEAPASDKNGDDGRRKSAGWHTVRAGLLGRKGLLRTPMKPDLFSGVAVPKWCPFHLLLNSDLRKSDSKFHRTVAVFFSHWLHSFFLMAQVIRTHRNGQSRVFVAKEAVAILLQLKDTVNSRPEAVLALGLLVDYNLVRPVGGEHQFSDDADLFRFRSDEQVVAKRAVSRSSSDARDSTSAFTSSVEFAVCTHTVQLAIAQRLANLISRQMHQPSSSSSEETEADEQQEGTYGLYTQDTVLELMEGAALCSNSRDAQQVVDRLRWFGFLEECNCSSQESTGGKFLRFTIRTCESETEGPLDSSAADLGAFNTMRFCRRLYQTWRNSSYYQPSKAKDKPAAFLKRELIKWLVSDFSLTFLEAASLMSCIIHWGYIYQASSDQEREYQAGNGLTWCSQLYESAIITNGGVSSSSSSLSVFSADVSDEGVSSPQSEADNLSVTASVAALKQLSSLASSSSASPVASHEEVIKIAELLQTRWKFEKVVKNRRYLFKVYKRCFVGKEAVNWLIKEGFASSRLDAVSIMRHFCDAGIVHHVVGDHDFRDEYLFYKFDLSAKPDTGDLRASTAKVSSPGVSSNTSDNTGVTDGFARLLDDDKPSPKDVLYIGNVLRLHWQSNGLVHSIRQGLHVYQLAFVAQEAIEWFVEEGQVARRSEAVKIMQVLEEADLIDHVLGKNKFSDGSDVFRFKRSASQQVHQSDNTDDYIAPEEHELYDRLCLHYEPILKERHYHGRAYPSCVTGSALVDYLVRYHEDFTNLRPEAVAYCRDLYGQEVIQHVCGEHAFKDSGHFYFFTEDPEWKNGPISLLRRQKTISRATRGRVEEGSRSPIRHVKSLGASPLSSNPPSGRSSRSGSVCSSLCSSLPPSPKPGVKSSCSVFSLSSRKPPPPLPHMRSPVSPALILPADSGETNTSNDGDGYMRPTDMRKIIEQGLVDDSSST